MSIVFGVSGIALDKGRILLARRGGEPYRGSWSLPGGRVNPMEPHREALRREFLEETGLEVEVREPAGIAEAIERSRCYHYVIASYYVTITGGNLQSGDDAVEVRWVERSEMAGLALTPKLLHYLNEFGVWPRAR